MYGETYEVYSQIVYWRPNLFKVPSGSCEKEFVAEQTEVEPLALTAAMTLPELMLQKPHAKSKVQEHIACL